MTGVNESPEEFLSFEAVKEKIISCRNDFIKILNQIGLQKTDKSKEKFARKALSFARKSSSGQFGSETIENVFLNVARRHSCEDLPQSFQENSILHVMSVSYNTGGHTRVVERWIELDDQNTNQSVLFTRKRKQVVPERLVSAVNSKNGKLIFLDDHLSDGDKGLELRKIASNFEFIVLHIHMDDPVPLIAFGNEEFKRPVMFFNHADHKFWIGASISDIVVNFRKWGEDICLNRRKHPESYILSIPVDAVQSEQVTDKSAIREKLGLPQDKKIIATVGSTHKYKPVINWNMLPMLETILQQRSDVMITVVGPSASDLPAWDAVSKKYNDRILLLGRLQAEQMFDYLRASDLVLDSFPMIGGTALLDAVACDVPVLSLKSPTGQMDYVLESDAYCDNEEIFMSKIFTLLSDGQAAKNNIFDVMGKSKKYNSVDMWKQRMRELYAKARSMTHTIHDLTISRDEELQDIDMYLYFETVRRKHVFGVSKLINMDALQANGKKSLEVLFLGKYVVKLPFAF
jgi:Glycosyl transferases group 1